MYIREVYKNYILKVHTEIQLLFQSLNSSLVAVNIVRYYLLCFELNSRYNNDNNDDYDDDDDDDDNNEIFVFVGCLLL